MRREKISLMSAKAQMIMENIILIVAVVVVIIMMTMSPQMPFRPVMNRVLQSPEKLLNSASSQINI